MAVIESDLSDIQFLGNWNSQQPSSPSSFVSAIVLTPEGSPSEITRTFSRTQTSVVHVGRTTTIDSAHPAEDRATFFNPVMSRNHAKITFTDSGSVFVIDTNSHHGTWVARSTSEFKLAGESPFQLHDGDRLTFGKEVQRNGILHSPLTVIVKLLHSASTPSSMSISSSSVSPASKGSSPRPRNRFGLGSSSDSDASSDNEDCHESDPCTGPNAIRVELPFHRLPGILDSPKSPNSIAAVQSDPGSPVCQSRHFSTSRRSSPLRVPTSPIEFASDLMPPVLELQGMDMPPDATVEANLSSNAHQRASPTPPWRCLNDRPWRNLSLFDRMPDLLQDPPLKIGRLLNPLWMRTSIAECGDDRGGRPSLLNRFQNNGSAVNVHENHDDQPQHGSLSNHIHHFPHLHVHHAHDHSHGRQGVRLDANWGSYGQNGVVMKDIKTLNERFDELKREIEILKSKEDVKEKLVLVISRLDELSNELRDKIDENAKFSQQALVGESSELEALKITVEGLQNDMSIFKAHKSAMQTDIKFLHASFEDLKNSVKDNFEKHTNDMATLAGDILKTRQDEAALRGDFEALRNQYASHMFDLMPLKTNMSEVNTGIETLQTNVQSANTSLIDIQGEIHALKRTHASEEQDLPPPIREQVRIEVKALIEQDGELSSIIGKRKRGDDDSIHAPAPGNIPAPSESRPRKRLRVVVDCAAAGVLGALGAWLGLAFL